MNPPSRDAPRPDRFGPSKPSSRSRPNSRSKSSSGRLNLSKLDVVVLGLYLLWLIAAFALSTSKQLTTAWFAIAPNAGPSTIFKAGLGDPANTWIVALNIAAVVLAVLAFCAVRIELRRASSLIRLKPAASLRTVIFAVVGALCGTGLLTLALGVIAPSSEGVFRLNQILLDSWLTRGPWVLSAFCFVVFLPFLEVYVFHHLAIGKLNRKLPLGLCLALSTLLFATFHGAGFQTLDLVYRLPSLALAAALAAAYLFSGKNLLISYSTYALRNLMIAVVIISNI